MSFSPAALAAARQRHQQTIAELAPITVRVGGKNYKGAGRITAMSLSSGFGDDGLQRTQRLVCSIAKSDLPHQPAVETEIAAEGRSFTIKSVSGVHADEVAWHITAEREPVN